MPSRSTCTIFAILACLAIAQPARAQGDHAHHMDHAEHAAPAEQVEQAAEAEDPVDGGHAGHTMPAEPAQATELMGHTKPAAHMDHAMPVEPAAPAEHMEHMDHAAHGDAAQHADLGPALPEGMSLDQVLDQAEQPPSGDYPSAFMDDMLHVFALVERLEYRLPTDSTPDYLAVDAQGWIGNDAHKFWWKHESEWVIDGDTAGESETDMLYSRLIAPFWSLQLGVQYANEFTRDDYEATWSGVIALQGMSPYMFEMDNSLYVSEHGDVSLQIEAEYDLRITQRLVLQPHAALAFYAQDIPEHDIGAGLTEVTADLRLRYEIKREFAPYIGIGYRSLVGETQNRAAASGEDSDQLYLIAGLRLAF